MTAWHEYAGAIAQNHPTGCPSATTVATMTISQYPGFWISLVTIGIAKARWVADTNKLLGRGGAGFWFAWFLLPFAHYGVASRLNEALAAMGSSHRESPFLAFLFTGWPFIGAKKRLRRATAFYNDGLRVQGAAV